jgi:hypothetical protein
VSHDEPEAAYLRNVIRKVRVLSDGAREDADASAAAHNVLSTLVAICDETLKRPRTNGKVIDDLQRKLGDAKSIEIDLMAARREQGVMQAQIQSLTDEVSRLRRQLAPGGVVLTAARTLSERLRKAFAGWK